MKFKDLCERILSKVYIRVKVDNETLCDIPVENCRTVLSNYLDYDVVWVDVLRTKFLEVNLTNL